MLTLSTAAHELAEHHVVVAAVASVAAPGAAVAAGAAVAVADPAASAAQAAQASAFSGLSLLQRHKSPPAPDVAAAVSLDAAAPASDLQPAATSLDASCPHWEHLAPPPSPPPEEDDAEGEAGGAPQPSCGGASAGEVAPSASASASAVAEDGASSVGLERTDSNKRKRSSSAGRSAKRTGSQQQSVSFSAISVATYFEPALGSEWRLEMLDAEAAPLGRSGGCSGGASGADAAAAGGAAGCAGGGGAGGGSGGADKDAIAPAAGEEVLTKECDGPSQGTQLLDRLILGWFEGDRGISHLLQSTCPLHAWLSEAVGKLHSIVDRISSSHATVGLLPSNVRLGPDQLQQLMVLLGVVSGALQCTTSQ